MTALKRIEAYKVTSKPQPWGTETTIAETPDYTGKVLFYRAREGGGLQYHMLKDETFYLHSGEAIVYCAEDDGAANLRSIPMKPGDSFHVPAGAPHQFIAVTDCLVFEASTPGTNDRVNVAHRYGLVAPEGTLPTTYSDEQIAAFEAGL